MTKGKVLFNEKCSVCNFEIQHYKKRSDLEFTDCSEMSDKYLKALHVKFENGKELAGVAAFIYVWNNTKEKSLGVESIMFVDPMHMVFDTRKKEVFRYISLPLSLR